MHLLFKLFFATLSWFSWFGLLLLITVIHLAHDLTTLEDSLPSTTLIDNDPPTFRLQIFYLPLV